MKYGINTLDDFEVAGKTVLCRVDINSPIDPASGDLADTTRLRGCAPTVSELADKGARVVLLAHQGGDLEYQNFASTSPTRRSRASSSAAPSPSSTTCAARPRARRSRT